LPRAGYSVTFTLIVKPLRRSFKILKWLLLTLIFWLVLGFIFIYLKSNASTGVFIAALAGWITGFWFVFHKTRHKASFFLSFFILFLLLWFGLQTSFVQNFLVSKVTKTLSAKLNADISIQHISYSFFDKMDLQGLLVKDQKKDTILFAGSTKVNITDWFFLQSKPVIQYVELSDVSVDLHRSDSVWNYQFLVDFFSGPKKMEKTGNGMDFDVKRLKLNDIFLKQDDHWTGRDMTVSLKALDLQVDEFDQNLQKLSIGSLTIDDPLFRQYDYEGNRDKLHIARAKRKTSDTTATQQKGWTILAKKIHISNGEFDNEKEDADLTMQQGLFDADHIRFAKINGDLKNVKFEGDSVTAHIRLATKERSGFEVKRLEAQMKFTPSIMEFEDLDLVTNKSRLRNYYSMKYDDFDEDMGHFMHNVLLDGRFIDSEVSSDDLAYFAPELKDWNRTFFLNGNAKGTIDNLTARRMQIKSGSSIVEGSIGLRGLPDIDKTFIDFKSDNLETNFDEVASIIPSLTNIKEVNLSRLGNIRYRGNFTGFLNDFVGFGTVNTSLGTVTGDINLKLPSSRPPVYSGKISTEGFRLGNFLNENTLGAITFNGKVNGSGVTPQTLKATFDGNIKSVEYQNYAYQNVIVKGNFEKKLFSGFASIDDPNLKIDELTGTINLNNAAPEFNFDAVLSKSDFKKLQLTNHTFELTGRFNLNFTGDNIDNFLGTAKITNASLRHENFPLSFDSLVITSNIQDGQKFLSVQSNELDAHIKGKYQIIELPDAFKVFLSRYYPAYIKRPGYVVKDQDFSFEIKTKEADQYFQLIDKRLRGFDNSVISGNLKLKDNDLNVRAEVPTFSYDGKVFNNIMLESHGTLDSLQTSVMVEDIAINDSLHLPNTNLRINSSKDTSMVSIVTSASKTISEASINARVLTLSNGVSIHFFPSSFILNDKKWQLEKDGEITFNNSRVSANEVKFIQGNQQITIATEPSGEGRSDDIVVGLTDVSIDGFTSLVMTEPKLDGLMSGTVRINDPFGRTAVEADTKIRGFRSGADSVGEVNLIGNYDVKSGMLTFKAKADQNKDNLLDVDGIINTKDSTGTGTRIAIKSERLNLSFLNEYLSDIFSDIKGYANTSDLAIVSNGKNLQITGSANIDSASLIVNFTQCRYKFANESILFNPDEIDFGSVILKDTLNNTATLTGKIYHRFFNDVEFEDIKISTNKMLLLNTTKKDNSQFYGKVIGRANVEISGTQDNVLMSISGEPSRTDSSHIYIVSANSIESNTIDYIDFIQFGNRIEETFKSRSAANVVVDMELTANTNCKIDVILDETTGDVIKGEGSGLLKIRVGNREPLTINGRYEIAKGEYRFNFQTFLQKYFTVSGGTLEWSGDPYKANINIQAEYVAENVNFSSLSNNSGSVLSSNSFQQKSNVIVIAKLTETLLKPAIDFEFKLPAGTPITDFLILKRLEQFKQDKNEMNKQVTSLLLFNSFINNNQNFINAGAGYNVISGTIGGVVSNAVSGFFNNFLQRYVKNLAFNFDLNSYIDNAGTTLQNNVARLQAAARSNFVYTAMNGRLIVSLGVNLDYNNPYVNAARTNNVLVTPDITAEWILTKDGRVRIVGFNRTNYDLIGQRNRTGVSLSYRKEMDHLSQIFKSRKRLRLEAEQGKTTDEPEPEP